MCIGCGTLHYNNTFMMKAKRPIVLLILDGWGIGEDDAHNSIFLADTPHIDKLLATYPNGPIGAAGEHIGLESAHQGSTEMGHLIISAGRNVLLAQMQVKKAISDGSTRTNAVLLNAMRQAKETGSRVHLMGLLSDAGVHSYDTMCHELLRLAAQEGLSTENVLIHIFSDGRDTPPESLPQHVARLQHVLKETGVGQIASVQGRYWAMDRDHRWERVEKAYDLLVLGRGVRNAQSIEDAITQARTAKETDEFISPTQIVSGSEIQNGDVVINFNYRVDREIEITKALIEPQFEAFTRAEVRDFYYVAMLPYYEGMPAPAVFDREELKMKNILPEVLTERGYTQFRVTETEKWVYVTKIFNGMREDVFAGEERLLIPSDKVETFDLAPDMQAEPIAHAIADALRNGKHDVIVSNICNADMLGHTGNKEATIIGCQAIDRAVGIIMEALHEVNGIMIITADHGDAEVMWDFDNEVPHTQHTDNFVPFILVDDERRHVHIREAGALCDVAPTILELLGEEKPEEMTGQSLIIDTQS